LDEDKEFFRVIIGNHLCIVDKLTGRVYPTISGGDSGSTTTETVQQRQIAPLTAAERRTQESIADLFEIQADVAGGIAQIITDLFPKSAELQEAQLTALQNEIGQIESDSTLRAALNEKALAQAEGRAPFLSPDQQLRVDQVFSRQREVGTRNIQQFAEEQAGRRGLNLTDTPIAQESLRQVQELESNIGAAQAGAELNLFSADRAFFESIRQFQEGLEQSRLLNVTGRAAVPQATQFAQTSQVAGQTGLGLLGQQQQERFAAAPIFGKQTSSRSTGLLDIIGAVGAGAQGIGLAAGPLGFGL